MKNSSKKIGKIQLDINDLLNHDKETDWNFTILKEFEDGYPKKTITSCWWCCHSFENQPLGLPHKYEPLGDVFKVIGCFCSIECIYAYVLDNQLKYKKVMPIDIKFMYKKISGDKEFKMANKLKRAPERNTLVMFGGRLSIEQFRQCDYPINVLQTPLISINLSCESTCMDKNIQVKFSNTSKNSNINNIGIKKSLTPLVEKIIVEKKVPKKKTQKKTIGELVSFV
jgi:hypothetical protein